MFIHPKSAETLLRRSVLRIYPHSSLEFIDCGLILVNPMQRRTEVRVGHV
jgi:hypothetical protein